MPNPMRLRAIEGLEQGQSFTYSRTFNQEDTELFGDMTRDYNPVHYDTRWSSAKGFDRPICHGLLVASMMTQIGGQMGWLASRFDLHFKKPVYFGDTITCTVTLNDIDEKGRVKATADFVNQKGSTVLTALLEGILAGQAEREILKTMVVEGDPTNKFNR